jgi:hypothetical protein
MNPAKGTRPWRPLLLSLAGHEAGMSKDNPEASPKQNVGHLMDRISAGLPSSAELLPLLRGQAWDSISAKSFQRMLRIAGKMETSPEAFRSFLPSLLRELGIDLPDGVLKPAPGRPGRPRKVDNATIYEHWLTLGCPSPGSQKFARECFGSAFARANPKERKKMIDRCYRAVKREATTKSPVG